MTCCAIVPTFNRAHLIGRTLESLLAQTVPLAQIIVVNDGSTDSTEQAVQAYGSRITYLAKKNGGKSSAINLAFRHLHPGIEFIWIFDDDDIAFPDALERHLAALAAPGVGFSYSSYIAATGNPDGSITPVRDVRTPRVEPDRFLSELLIANFVPHPSLVVRRTVQEKAGLYDEGMVRSQDFDMILRIARIADPAWVDGPTYYRRYHDGLRGSGQDRFAASRYDEKGHAYEKKLFRKIYGSWALREYLPRSCEFNEDDALIARITVMAIRGLWDLCAADAMRLSAGAMPLSPRNVEQLWRVASRPHAALDMERSVVSRIPRQLRRVMAKAFLLAITGGAIPVDARVRIAWKTFLMAVAMPSDTLPKSPGFMRRS